MIEKDKKYADGMTPDLHPAQIEAYRKMSFADKRHAAFLIYQQARNLTMVAVRSRHPEWSEEQVVAETSRIFLHAKT